jgi:thymidylate synthase
MAWKTMVTELIWFLRGDTNIKYLVDNGCNIWNGDCYKFYATSHIKEVRKQQRSMREEGWETVTLDPNYLSQEQFINKIKTDDEFAKKWGELGKIYGFQWRNWNGKTKDELYQDYLKKIQTK